MTHPDYRFFYVRAEPSLAAKTEFALRSHKPHKREPKGFPVACVAYVLDDVPAVDFAFSTHNPLDTYSRDAAKAWALFYLTTKNKYRGRVQSHEKGLIVKARIMELLTLPGAPLRVQRAARYWLSRFTKPSRLATSLRTAPPALNPSSPFGVDAPPADVDTLVKGPVLVGRKKATKKRK